MTMTQRSMDGRRRITGLTTSLLGLTILVGCESSGFDPAPYEQAGLEPAQIDLFEPATAPPLTRHWRGRRSEARSLRADGRLAESVEVWREMAAAGLPTGYYELARAYRRGQGVPADPAQAVSLFETTVFLASPLRPQAQHELAEMLLDGEGTAVNRTLALMLLRDAVAADRIPAMHDLAVALIDSGDPAERREAVAVLRRAATLGDVESRFIFIIPAWKTFFTHHSPRARQFVIDLLSQSADWTGNQ